MEHANMVCFSKPCRARLNFQHTDPLVPLIDPFLPFSCHILGTVARR